VTNSTFITLDKQEEHLILNIKNTFTLSGTTAAIPDIQIVMDTMDIIKTGKKGKHLNTLEKYHIYGISKDNVQKNDTYIDTYNPIFETLYKLYAR
jgi:hypothetical protein